MNREIKFRAWDKKRKTMLEVPLKVFDLMHYGLEDELELMQFTGLKDKNGKEIYEGDILKQGLVSGGVALNVVEWEIYKWSNNILLTSEVMGNIYENPELLK